MVPESVTSIDDYAFGFDPFMGEPTMSEIYLPSSLTYIGNGAFLYQEALAAVYYDGTEEMWEQVFVGEEDNENWNPDKVHCIGKANTQKGTIFDKDAKASLSWELTGLPNENGKTIGITFHGISADDSVFIAVYATSGQMLSVRKITQSGGSADVTGGHTAKIFWLDADGTPRAENAVIKLAAQ